VERILDEVTESVATWPELVADSGVEGDVIKRIAETHRLKPGQA
jgi:hypothetical protein